MANTAIFTRYYFIEYKSVGFIEGKNISEPL